MIRSKNVLQFCSDVKEILIDYPSRSYNIGRKLYYLDIPCSFDIYTSTVEIEEGMNRAVVFALYVSIGENYIICRHFEEIAEIYNRLKKYLIHNHIIFYSNNINRIFWQYRKRIHFSGFRDKEGNPLRLEIGNIEIRDYKRIALFKPIAGKVHSGIFPETELEPEEVEEIEQTGLRIYDDIRERIKTDQGAGMIPQTISGYAKRELTRNQGKNKNWIRIDRSEYEITKRAYIGGYCAINALWKGYDIKERVISFDEDSAFIAAMLSEQFPASDGVKWEDCTQEEFNAIKNDPVIVWTGKIDFVGLHLKENIQCGMIPEARATIKGKRKVYSGFVTDAEYIRMCICSADFETISYCYTWEKMHVETVYTYRADYLPKYIIKTLCDLYEQKARLKNTGNKNYLYEKKKAILNSCYGLFGVSPVTWGSIEKYNERFDRIGCFQYAPFITAYARRNLISGIVPHGEDFIYSDTDSIKIIAGNPVTEKFLNWYNKRIENKIYCTLKHYNINAPEVVRKCGKWTQDGEYFEFKTLGQKKYLYMDADGIHGCISGLKKEVSNELTFEQFSENYIISKEYSGAVSVTHSGEEWSATIPDRDGVVNSIHEYGSYTEIPVEYSLSAEHETEVILKKILNGGF